MGQPPSRWLPHFTTSLSLSMLFLTTYQSYSSVILLKTQCFSALYISLNVTCSNALALLLLRLLASKRRTLAQLLLSFHQEHRLQQLPLLIRAYIILLLLHEGIRYNRQLRRYLFTMRYRSNLLHPFSPSHLYIASRLSMSRLYLLVHYSILS